MCSFPKCHSLHSLLHINDAAEVVFMRYLLTGPPLDPIIRSAVGRRLLYLGIGSHHKTRSQVSFFNLV